MGRRRLDRAHLAAVGFNRDGRNAQLGRARGQLVDLARLQAQAAVAGNRAAQQAVAVRRQQPFQGIPGQLGAGYFQKGGRPRGLECGNARAGRDDGAPARSGHLGGQAEGGRALAAAPDSGDHVGAGRIEGQVECLVE